MKFRRWKYVAALCLLAAGTAAILVRSCPSRSAGLEVYERIRKVLADVDKPEYLRRSYAGGPDQLCFGGLSVGIPKETVQGVRIGNAAANFLTEDYRISFLPVAQDAPWGSTFEELRSVLGSELLSEAGFLELGQEGSAEYTRLVMARGLFPVKKNALVLETEHARAILGPVGAGARYYGVVFDVSGQSGVEIILHTRAESAEVDMDWLTELVSTMRFTSDMPLRRESFGDEAYHDLSRMFTVTDSREDR